MKKDELNEDILTLEAYRSVEGREGALGYAPAPLSSDENEDIFNTKHTNPRLKEGVLEYAPPLFLSSDVTKICSTRITCIR